MSETTVQLSFPARADYLLLARLALTGMARETALDEDVLADLKLAVTEACGNAVRHAYPAGEGEVMVRYALSQGVLEMIVEDQGGGLDEASAAAGTSSPRIDGGMGFSIIRAVVDELEVGAGSGGRGTTVRMVKRLRPVDP